MSSTPYDQLDIREMLRLALDAFAVTYFDHKSFDALPAETRLDVVKAVAYNVQRRKTDLLREARRANRREDPSNARRV